jgi:peptidyl-prolyl cis-trans isomerase C
MVFTRSRIIRSLLLVSTVCLAACSTGIPFLSTAIPSLTPTATETPTATPLPVALTVNGESITKIEFEAEWTRYQEAQAALGLSTSSEEARQAVMDDFTDSLLLAQGAVTYGFSMDDNTLQNRLDALAAQVGGMDALAAWQAAHGYSETDFRTALRRQVAAAWMRDQVVASVQKTAEQVHLKQILVFSEEEAKQAQGYLQAGWTFNDLAAQYDPVSAGDLGWAPRGYLFSREVEQAAFAMQPGETSSLIQDAAGYHLLYLVERNASRLLSPDALLTLQEQALNDWLTQRRNESTIVVAP